jgi:hypothetical protein
VGRSLKLYQALFHAPAVPATAIGEGSGSTAATTTTAAATTAKAADAAPSAAAAAAADSNQPMYPHAILKIALETFTVLNWQLFA